MSKISSVYRAFDKDDVLLYVGVTMNRSRFDDHRSSSSWFPLVVRIDVEQFISRTAALAAEKTAIQTEHPKFNIVHGGSSGVVKDRARRALAAYVDDDMTLEQIGKRWGVTRERIRQDVTKYDKTLFKLAKRRRQARTRLRFYVREGRHFGFRVCHVCGERFDPQTQQATRYCSPVHRQVEVLFRYQTDDNQRTLMRSAMARRNLRLGEGSSVHSHNVLNDTVAERGRWLVEGSLTFHWAVRACVLDWPLFDRLHADVQKQVREFVQGEAVSA